MFKLEIRTGGAAFRDETREDRNGDYRLDDTGAEVRRILNEIGIKLRNGYWTSTATVSASGAMSNGQNPAD